MNSLVSIIYETGALVGVVVFIVGTLKTLLEDNAKVDRCKRKESITRKKRFLLNNTAVQDASSAQDNAKLRHKDSMEHYTIEKMYSKNISLMQSESCQNKGETKVVENDSKIDNDSKSFFSDVLDSLENNSIDFYLPTQVQIMPKISGKEDNNSSIKDTELRKDMFDLIQEKKADFSMQNLTNLSTEVFSLLDNICWLNLSHNLIKNLIQKLPNSFKNLKRLQVLDLSCNNLQDLGKILELTSR